MVNLLFFLFICLCCLQFSTSQNDEPGSRSPENDLCKTIIRPAGYLCTENTVETKDGFFVTLQRVSSPNNQKIDTKPILLLHGLFTACDAWFLEPKEESLGYILADQGFDVWTGNFRGGSWTFGNKFLSPQDEDFWNWSWEDSAWYDLPVMLEHMYSTTKSKTRIVTLSQGTMSTLAALTQPKISEMVEAVALLCPTPYLDHTTSALLHTLVGLHYDDILTSTGATKFELKSILPREVAMPACSITPNCANLLAPITGKSCCIRSSTIKDYFDRIQPTSLKNLRHYFQLIRSGTFSQYDYGSPENEKLYGSEFPTEFNLSTIPKSVAIWIGHGGNDALSNEVDVQRIIKALQCEPQVLYLEDYGHLDFIWSRTAKEDVFDHIIQFFNSL